MRKILRDLRDAVAECRAQAASDSQSQLFAIIQGNFHPSQTNAVSMRAWLDFWAASMHQPVLRACSAPTIGDSIPTFAASSAASCRCGRRVIPRAGWRQ